jgi:hypothetical protein
MQTGDHLVARFLFAFSSFSASLREGEKAGMRWWVAYAATVLLSRDARLRSCSFR